MIIDMTRTEIERRVQRRWHDSLSVFEWNLLSLDEHRWCFMNYGSLYRLGDDDSPQYSLNDGQVVRISHKEIENE